MNSIEKKIIAIGGGGFTHQSDETLDDFVINQITKKNKKDWKPKEKKEVE